MSKKPTKPKDGKLRFGIVRFLQIHEEYTGIMAQTIHDCFYHEPIHTEEEWIEIIDKWLNEEW